jgi:cytochrome c-type biogenesis protein CcmF
MGVAPLSAWGHSTVKSLGRAIWKPSLFAAAVTILIFFTYTKNLIALAAFFLVALVLTVTLFEFWRAARARQIAQEENFFTALSRLTGRNRRRYGGYVIHISMMLMAVGILGIEIFQMETQGTVAVDGKMSVGGYTLEYNDIANFQGPDQREVTRAVVNIYKNGTYVGQLFPRIDYYPDAQQTMTIPGQRSTLEDDVYVLLVDWQPASSIGATFKVYINPLVNWLWIGSLLFLVGVFIAAWPDKDPEYAAARVRSKAYQPSSAD